MLELLSLVNGHRPSALDQGCAFVFPGHDPSPFLNDLCHESRSASDFYRRLSAPAAEPERQTEQECAEDDPVRSDQPHERQRAGSWYEHRQHAEGDRQDAVQRQPSLTRDPTADRKSTRLNSSHLGISYAV